MRNESFATLRRLEDLVTNGDISYGIVQPGYDTVVGVPIVRVKDIRDGRIDQASVLRVDPKVSDRHSRTVLEGGELLVTIVGTVGESAVVPKEMAGWNVARAVAVVRPSGVSAEWIRLCLETSEVKQALTGVLNTTVQSTLNLADLKRLLIPVPPARDRVAIAEVLTALDDKSAMNTVLAASSVALAAAMFDMALIGSSLSWAPLGEIATTILGGTPGRDVARYWEGGTIAWLNSGKANEFRVLSPSEWITQEALDRSAAKIMPVGTTLLAITGATLGQIARLEIAAAGNQSLVGIWSDDPSLNDWLYFAVQSKSADLLRFATGAAQQHVNKRNVDGLLVPLISDSYMRAWARVVRPLLDRAANADRESLQVDAVRDVLLPQLMSGKIRVKDAEQMVGGLV